MALQTDERTKIFRKLKNILKSQCPPMVCAKDTDDACEVIGNTPAPYGSTKKIIPGMYFASAVARKDMVSFYFFPLYSNPKEFAKIAPTAMKQLKGKTCFNFKKKEQVVEGEMKALLSQGVKIWKKMGYVK